LRHLDDEAARAMRRRYSRRIVLAGVVIAFLFTIPVVNLLTPLIAAAAMVHVFKRISARPA
jgi:CysZ protein